MIRLATRLKSIKHCLSLSSTDESVKRRLLTSALGQKSGASFTIHISMAGNAIASIRPSVRLFPLYLQNRSTVDLELLYASRP